MKKIIGDNRRDETKTKQQSQLVCNVREEIKGKNSNVALWL